MVVGCAWLKGETGVANKVSFKLEPFAYEDVKLLPGLFKSRFDVNREYLMSLDSTSLLYPFYKEAVIRLPRNSRPLGGWEAMSVDLRGHFLGHYLSACARIYATAGDLELKRKCDRIVSEMARIQKANGNGYIGPVSEKVFTALEAGRQTDVWAPYYVIHKVIMGLYEMYKHADNEQALEVVSGMVDYIKARTDKLSNEVMAETLEEEHGGMTEALFDLYGITGEEKYFQLAKRFEHLKFLDPMALNEDKLSGIHANTQIPKIYGAARAYELTGDTRYKTISQNFWNILADTRTYPTGGSNSDEYWGKPGKLSDTLGESNQETCTTYNMMWLANFFLRWSGNAKYADFYEKNLYNGILSIQNPADGQFCYFTPMKSGSNKRFGTPENSFWCCYGTGVQAFADLTGSLYFRDENNIYVNLFTPSEVTWRRPSSVVRLVQSTKYPEVSSTQLTVRISEPSRFGLKVRVPWWATNGVEVKVNQSRVEVDASPGTYLALKRTWKDQDVVTVSMPMSLYTEPLIDDPDLVAVFYGPTILAGLVFDDVTFAGNKSNPKSWIVPATGEERVLASHMLLVNDRLPNPATSGYYTSPFMETKIERERIPLTFQTSSPNPRVQFIPLYQVLSRSYGLYFRVE